VSPTAPARPAADTGRRPSRRELILAAAMDLFHRDGYHATGMDDIGAAAGISGPGVYRHFRSKEEILAIGLERALAGALERARAIVARTDSSRRALEGLVAGFVEGLLADPWLSTVLMGERHALNPATRRRVERAEQSHVEEWVGALQRERPELGEAEARLMVRAGLWTCLSMTYHDGGLEPAREGEMLTRMVCAALRCDVGRVSAG
jgi:AcrR family transcriptional regulator